MNRFNSHRALFSCFAAALFLLLASAAQAADAKAEARQLEAKALDVENLFQQLLGSSGVEPVFEEHGDGLSSLSFPLPPELRERLIKSLGAGDEKAKTFFTLAAGQQLSEPSSARVLIHSAFSDQRFDYNYRWVAVNLADEGVRRATQARTAGPGKKFNRKWNVNYPGDRVKLVWYNPGHGFDRAGVHVFQVKIAGAPAVITRMMVQ